MKVQPVQAVQPVQPVQPVQAGGARGERALGQSVLSLAGFCLAAVCGFGLSVAVGRALGPAGSGVFYRGVAIVTILTAVLVFGADTGLIRAVAGRRALGQTAALRPTLVAAVLPLAAVAVVGVILAGAVPGPLGRLLFGGEPHSTALARSVVVGLVFAALGQLLLAGALRGFGTVAPFVLIWQTGLSVVRLGGVVTAALLTHSVVAAFAAWALPSVVVAALAAVLTVRRLGREEAGAGLVGVPARPPRAQVTAFWGFAAARGVASVFESSIIWFQVLVVALVVGNAEAGVYASAARFVTTGTLVLQASRMGIASQLAGALARGDAQSAQRLYGRSTLVVVAASWPLYLTLITWGATVLRVFGPGFSSGATALAIVAVAELYYMGAGNVSTVLLMGGRSRWQALNVGCALVVNVVLDVVLVPRFGIEGAAIAWAASIVTDTTLCLYEVRVLLGLRAHDRPFAAVAAAASGVFGGGILLARLVLPHDLGSLVVALVVVGAGYLAVLVLLRDQILPGATGIDVARHRASPGHLPRHRAPARLGAR